MKHNSWTRVALAVPWFLLAGTVAVAQQAGRLEGRVVSGTEGVEGVTVLVEGTGRSAITDSRGFFRISGIPAGSRVVAARRLGFEPAKVNVTVGSGATATVELALTPAAFRLSDIVVTAAREEERRLEIPVTIGVIDGGQLRSVKPAHPSEIMNQVAGVWVNVTGGEGHMTAIRQPIGTDPVYLFLEDGIPSRSTGFFNHNALYEINLPQSDRIEVSKGPANALYGSDAIGGVVNVSTRAPARAPELTLSAEGGQYTWGRGLVSASSSWGRTGIRADVNYTRTDGWRDATSYDRQAGTVRWDQDLGGGARVKTLATFSLIDQQTAGSSAISRNDYLNNPTINYTPISLREVKAYRLSSALEKATGSSLLSLTPYARYDWMRLLPNWSLTFDAQDYTTDNYSAGVLAKFRRDFEPLRTRLILGADADYSPGRQVEYSLTATRVNGVFTSYTQGALIYDYAVTYFGVSPYAQIETSPTERLRITGGLRYDYSGYQYDNHLTPLATGRWRRPDDMTVRYDHLSPKIGATYEFDPAFNLFASYRHGFRAPSQGQLFRQGSTLNTVGLQPIKANNYEVGVRGRIARRVDYDVSAYSLVKHDDVVSFTRADGSTEVQNAGNTTHRGVELQLGGSIGPSLRVDFAYSYAVHKYGTWRPSATVDLTGKEMPTAPRHMGNASFTLAPPRLGGAQASLQWTMIGPYWQDQANTVTPFTAKYWGHNLFHFRATYPIEGRFTLSARVMNLTHIRYAESSAYTTARGQEFAPGMPRTVYAGMQYEFK